MHDDVSQPALDQRRAELASILALGVLRLYRRQRLDPPSLPQIEPESSHLLNLAPDIQEAVVCDLNADRSDRTEHDVRPVAAMLDWPHQRKLWHVRMAK